MPEPLHTPTDKSPDADERKLNRKGREGRKVKKGIDKLFFEDLKNLCVFCVLCGENSYILSVELRIEFRNE